MEERPGTPVRTRFIPEYKVEVVRPITATGKSVGEVAFSTTAVRAWMARAEIDEKAIRTVR